MDELREFTKVFVDPKFRKMRFEAYTVVAAYPWNVPKVKIASLKWAWKQKTERGWCPLPTSILQRFKEDSKQFLPKLMTDVEGLLQFMSKVASAVAGGPDDQRARTVWCANVDVKVMSKIFAAPAVEEGLEVKLQEAIAEDVALKVYDLLGGKVEESTSFPAWPEGNQLLTQCRI